jgi:hypothetical protein
VSKVGLIELLDCIGYLYHYTPEMEQMMEHLLAEMRAQKQGNTIVGSRYLATLSEDIEALMFGVVICSV